MLKKVHKTGKIGFHSDLSFNNSLDCNNSSACKMAPGSKELVIVPNENHVDLYARENMISFTKLEDFFRKYLK